MMDRKGVLLYVSERYGIEPDYPWARNPNYAILRHPANRKWFAAIVDITEDKLGLPGDTLIDALDLKCDPPLIELLVDEPGFFPAYHMNKEHWITILLDGTVSEEKICSLIDMSYDLTTAKSYPKKKERSSYWKST